MDETGLKPVPPVDKSGRYAWPVRFPYLHLEAQTVDEMLAGWRNQQLCGDLDHATIAGQLFDVLAAISGATTDQQRTRLPM